MTWTSFLMGYLGFTALLGAYATHVALTCRNSQRRADAYKVLKLVWCGATGATGLVTALVKLHEAGVV
jgi:hypothetical protein